MLFFKWHSHSWSTRGRDLAATTRRQEHGARGRRHVRSKSPRRRNSLYYTDKNKLRIDVPAGSPNVKVATFTVNKDAGGAEAGVERKSRRERRTERSNTR